MSRFSNSRFILTAQLSDAKLTIVPLKLTTGTQLGPYTILGPLGAGGMGEVYRARDARLGREVALKILTNKLEGDPDALERFDREARIVASLSHPNVVALYDYGNYDGTVCAITELLEGESLDRRLARERMSWRHAIELAALIADGLSSAHARGIVHRDLKPGNVFITRDGQIKILDFGLATSARVFADGRGGDSTVTVHTEPGTVLGTVGYMSPEQVRGEIADPRSDIFALGCILYEMLAWRRAFSGDTAAETLAAILRDQPAELSAAAVPVPPNVEAVVRRCLEKDREQRFQSARDLAFALRGLLGRSATAPPPTEPKPRYTLRRRTIAGALVVAALAVLAVAGWSRWSGGHRRIGSVAVLPLANRSGDTAQEYFVDGITDQLIAGLARIDGVRVTSRTSAMHYKGSPRSLGDIARELGVEAVVEGSVTRTGSRVEVTANLADASTQSVLWSATFERDVRDLPRLQGEIAQQVARTMSVDVSAADRAQFDAARQVNPEALDAYVRGRYYWNKRAPADLQQAVEEFRRAIDADPTYAAAYAGLADAYAQIAYSNLAAPRDAFPKAKAAASQAITLAPDLAEPHASLGFVHMYFDFDFDASEREFRRAIALDENSVTAHHFYSILLAALLRPDEARQQIERARVLDPLSPLVATDAGFETFYDRRYEEARSALEEAIQASPKAPLAHYWLARTFQAQGQNEKAIAEFELSSRAFGNFAPTIGGLGNLYGTMGRRDDALKMLAKLEELAPLTYATAYQRALVYVGLADRTQALTWLQQAFDDRVGNGLVWLLKDPRWDPMRGDPGFEDMVTKVGFPPESRARSPRPSAKQQKIS
jgi:serine/threonine-protein kinase